MEMEMEREMEMESEMERVVGLQITWWHSVGGIRDLVPFCLLEQSVCVRDVYEYPGELGPGTMSERIPQARNADKK